MIRILLMVSLLFSIACAQQRKEEATNNSFEDGVSVGMIEGKEIREASGLVASISNPGMLWTHNDSGNGAEIFLLDDKGQVKCIVQFNDIKNRDWEDITIGAGPEENKVYLYVGEIGDNNSAFEYKFLYRIEEPVIAEGVSDTTLTKIDTIKFKLSDGERDTEALMIDPVTKDLFIFSKREQRVNLYKLTYPLSTTETMTAEKVLEKLPFTLIVAGDISEDGNEILAKNYDNIFYWKRLPRESIEETIQRTPERLPYSPEPQGEAIAFSSKGDGYYTISERKKKLLQHLYFYKRAQLD